jgi:hypothetical protein
MTERSEILDMMGQLQLAGMRAAYDEIVSVGVKRQRRDDDGAARPPHASLRHRRNRQRQLAPQAPLLTGRAGRKGSTLQFDTGSKFHAD